MSGSQAIVRRIRAKDFAVQAAAASAGAAIVPSLAPLLADADEVVRELTVHCLAAVADPAAAPALAGALPDPDPQVAMAAARALEPVATPAEVPAVLRAYDREAQPLVRQQLGLVLGRCIEPGNLADIRRRWSGEPDAEARLGLTAALAKAGEHDARAMFCDGLRASAGQVRLRYLELAEYIGRDWLLPPLSDVLDDTTDLLRVAVDARPDLIQALRACDLAAWQIVRIGGASLAFMTDRPTNYTPEQLAAIRQFVRSRFP